MMACILASLAAASEWGQAIPMERDVIVGSSPGWSLSDKPPAHDDLISLVIMMKHQPDKMKKLEESFWAVSNPRDPRYGKHLSYDQVTELLSPAPGHLEKVVNWLKEAGSRHIEVSRASDIIDVTLDVAAAQSMLRTTFGTFKHKSGRYTLVRATREYSLPVAIADVIQIVGNVLHLPHIYKPIVVDAPSHGFTPSTRLGDWPASCNGQCNPGGVEDFVTPAVLAERYSLDAPPNASAGNNSMATAEFQGQGWVQADLDTFSSTCSLSPITVQKSIGTSPKGSGVEAELDIEYIKAIGGAIPLTNIYSDEYSLLNWVKGLAALGDGNIPLVHSVSYGSDEAQQTGADYMETCNDQFMALGARGVSILFASGDSGVCGLEGCGLLQEKPFHPDFPGSSPYITVVGGTDFTTRSSVGDETAWVSSGGGFSNAFGIPSYQTDAVAAYKTKATAVGNLPPQKLWNNTGRGYPDVAALAGKQNPYCVAIGGTFQGVAGTSAACPIVAALVARLNNLRLSAGRPPMGFLNPFLYQNAAAFNDVTTGINKHIGREGFTAMEGWDPATGLGTPNYAKLSSAAMK